MTFLLICFVTALLQVGVGEGRRIAGGDAIQIEDAPYTVSLQILLFKKPRHQCGGALISDKFVLTAAHCKLRLEITEALIELLVYFRRRSKSAGQSATWLKGEG